MKEDGMDLKRKILKCTREGKKYADLRRYDKTFSCYLSAFEAASASDNEEALFSCAFNIGALCALKTGDYENAVTYLQKAIRPDNGDSTNAEVFLLLGKAYEQLGNMDKAYENYCKAMKIFRRDRNAEKEIETLEKMVQVSKRRNDLQGLYEHVNELIRVCNVLTDGDVADPSTAQLKRQKWTIEKGYVLKDMNEPKKALDIAKDCFEELRTKNMEKVREAEVKEVHSMFNELGLLLTHLQEFPMAASCFLKLLELSKLTKPQLAITKQNLGAVYNFMYEWDTAIELHKEAADLHAGPHSRASQGHCYCNLAYAYFQLANQQPRNRRGRQRAQACYKKAHVYYHLAVEAAKETGDVKTQWQALEGLGSLESTQGNYKEAVEYYREAFTCVSRTSDREHQDRIMFHLQQALHNTPATPYSTSGRSTPLQMTSEVGTMNTFIRHPTNLGATMSSQLDGNMNTLVMKESVTRETSAQVK